MRQINNSENNWGKFELIPFLTADLLRIRALSAAANIKPKSYPLWFGLFSLKFLPILICRIAYWLCLYRLKYLAKVFAFINYMVFGIEITTRCFIGPGLFLPHTQGTVIGARRIGSNATIFQSVTLGAKELDLGFNESVRPFLADNVTVGAGAKVLGGISIGDGAIIGANSVVISDVPPLHIALGVPAKMREKSFEKK